MWDGHPWPEAEKILHRRAAFACGNRRYQLWLQILLVLTASAMDRNMARPWHAPDLPLLCQSYGECCSFVRGY